MKMKILSVLILLLVSLAAATVSAVPSVNLVKLNGNVVSESSTNFVRGFDKGEAIDISVQLVSLNEDAADVQVEAMIRGYDHDDLMDDISDVFDMKNNVTYTKDLELGLRERMDQGRYKLRILVLNKDGNSIEKDYELEVSAPRHNVAIKDVVLSPEKVQAGRAIVAKVRVKNYGAKSEDGVKVTVSIPALGVSDSDYIDELEAEGSDDDSATSEELFLRIPQSAKSGVYTVKAAVVYDDGDEEDTYTASVEVVGCDAEPEACGAVPSAPVEAEKTVIAYSTEAQQMTAGQAGAVYPVTITNTGSTSKTYVLSASAPWATVRFAPSNVMVVKAGETRTAQVYVAANSGVSGEQLFVVSVKDAAGDVLKDLTMKANVSRAFGLGGAKRALEIALVVLVVLLVLVGLIAAFNKLRGGSEGEAQTYY